MTFRILSLDGGGTWALLEAMALEDLFPNCSGHQILGRFDLAVANSGGSIVLAGLILNMKPSLIRLFFEDEAKRASIFSKKPWAQEELARGLPIFPRYVASEKRIGLEAIMGPQGNFALMQWPRNEGWPNGPGGDPVRFLIMAFDYDRLREDFLRSYAVPKTGAWAERVSLVEAVHASTNAPVIYFDEPALADGKRYWDGAMGAYNNPVMAGVVDAIALGVDPAAVEILSLGTGTVRLVPPDLAPKGAPPDLLGENVTPGKLTDLRRASSCITDDPPDAATFTAHVVLGNAADKAGRIVRLNPVVQPVNQNGAWTYPKGLPKEVFDPLTKLDMDAVENSQVELIKRLGEAWIHEGAPNQPIRMLDDLSCGLGDRTYVQAKARWRAMTGNPLC